MTISVLVIIKGNIEEHLSAIAAIISTDDDDIAASIIHRGDGSGVGHIAAERIDPGSVARCD